MILNNLNFLVCLIHWLEIMPVWLSEDIKPCSKTSCVCPSPRITLQGTVFRQDTEPSYHFKLFSIPSLTSFIRLLTCGEQPCRMQQEKLTRNWTISCFQHTQKAQICFYHLYPAESWLRSGARKNRYVMLGKNQFLRTPRGTDWPEGENSTHTHKSYGMHLSTFFAIFAGFKYYQISYQNLKNKVELLPLQWHRSKKIRLSVLVWLRCQPAC